jgi:hypothetical protein
MLKIFFLNKKYYFNTFWNKNNFKKQPLPYFQTYSYQTRNLILLSQIKLEYIYIYMKVWNNMKQSLLSLLHVVLFVRMINKVAALYSMRG